MKGRVVQSSKKGEAMKVALSGASGFVAGALKKAFPNFVPIERHDEGEALLQKLQGVDAVLNLAGAPIAARWDEAYKKVLWSSRIDTTTNWSMRSIKAMSNISFPRLPWGFILTMWLAMKRRVSERIF